jgi:hypothetical protein
MAAAFSGERFHLQMFDAHSSPPIRRSLALAFSWIERPRGHAWPQSLDGVATVKRLLKRRSERRISLEQSTAMSWLSYILSAKLVAALLSGDFCYPFVA